MPKFADVLDLVSFHWVIKLCSLALQMLGAAYVLDIITYEGYFGKVERIRWRARTRIVSVPR